MSNFKKGILVANLKKSGRGGAIVRQTLWGGMEALDKFWAEKRDNGEEPCSFWYGNPSVNWGGRVEGPREGPFGFAWTY